MLGLRQKLFLGFGGLLLIIVVIAIQGIIHLTQLGQSIDIILRENYQSVIACEEMKEAIERLDSGILFVFLGQAQEGTELIQKNETIFQKALETELNNITVPGEGEKARHLKELFGQYQLVLHNIQKMKPAVNQLQSYRNDLFPLFLQVKETANGILVLNQKNMNEANNWALSNAASARKGMYAFLGFGLILAVVFMLFTGKWILRPIERLIHYAEDIKQGNFDLFILDNPQDEIGQLSKTFNEMASSLRESRRSDLNKLARIQHVTEQTLNSLTGAVAIFDPAGKVEIVTEKARNVFGLKPDDQIATLPYQWIREIFTEAITTGQTTMMKGEQKIVRQVVDEKERHFQAKAIPIRDSDAQTTGVALVFQDVT